jgi:hypothetical protein
MLKQQYDASAFLSVIKKDDIRKWNLWEIIDGKDTQAMMLASKLKKNNYSISGLKITSHKNKKVYLPAEVQDYLALKLADRYLRRIYKVVQSDRGKIIRQIRAILEDGGDFTLIRADIKSFYETVDFNHCIEKIKRDMILSAQGVLLLSSLRDNYFKISTCNTGLPRGIGVSATLAELCLRSLDDILTAHQDVVFYARYVDDIFLISDKNKIDSVKTLLEEKVEMMGFNLNKSKQYDHDTSDNCSFDYLGYHFEVKTKISKDGKKERSLTINIAPEKVRKVKQRIYKSFLAYKKTNNFKLLLNRLSYLSCNKTIKKTENGSLMAGNAYNYRYVTDPACFKVFDGFIINIVQNFSFSPRQESKIMLVSFYRAFVNKMVAGFTRRQICSIKKVWDIGN